MGRSPVPARRRGLRVAPGRRSRRRAARRAGGTPARRSLPRRSACRRWPPRRCSPLAGGSCEAHGTAAIAGPVREAWAVLREPARRAAYERWWLQALGPLEPDQGRTTNGGGSGERCRPGIVERRRGRRRRREQRRDVEPGDRVRAGRPPAGPVPRAAAGERLAGCREPGGARPRRSGSPPAALAGGRRARAATRPRGSRAPRRRVPRATATPPAPPRAPPDRRRTAGRGVDAARSARAACARTVAAHGSWTARSAVAPGSIRCAATSLRGGAGGRRVARLGQPCERVARVLLVERGAGELRERVAQRQRDGVHGHAVGRRCAGTCGTSPIHGEPRLHRPGAGVPR